LPPSPRAAVDTAGGIDLGELGWAQASEFFRGLGKTREPGNGLDTPRARLDPEGEFEHATVAIRCAQNRGRGGIAAETDDEAPVLGNADRPAIERQVHRARRKLAGDDTALNGAPHQDDWSAAYFSDCRRQRWQ
jgi:hypothetical protein